MQIYISPPHFPPKKPQKQPNTKQKQQQQQQQHNKLVQLVMGLNNSCEI